MNGSKVASIEFRPKVLVVDDDEGLSASVTKWLRREGYVARSVCGGEEGLETLAQEWFDLVLLDLSMPRVSGWEILETFRHETRSPAFVVLTGHGGVEEAVRALRLGATDFVAKPTTLADLARKLERALDAPTLRRSLARKGGEVDDVVLRNPQTRDLFAMAERLGHARETSVLILGESGVGKEVLATRIHHRGARCEGPFVRVNLAALPTSMVEAELFGSVRGAYTGSSRDRLGLLRKADGGTLLLDELCEFDIELQAKLLRAIETQRFFPVGSDQEVTVDVQFLAATNRDPRVAVQERRLREDLYYRLSTFILEIPPLRDRPEDILPLAECFLAGLRTKLGRAPLEFSPAAQGALLSFDWPGNVRQLRNAVHRAVVIAKGPTVIPSDLGLPGAESTEEASPRGLLLEETRQQALETIERTHIERVMKIARGSPVRAAELLGVSRSTLWKKLRGYGLS